MGIWRQNTKRTCTFGGKTREGMEIKRSKQKMFKARRQKTRQKQEGILNTAKKET